MHALRVEFDSLVEVETLTRLNGTRRPGGAGAPELYDVEFAAQLAPIESLSFRVSDETPNVSSGFVEILGAVAGFERTPPYGRSSIGVIRRSPGMTLSVTGVMQFVMTENGWRKSEVVTLVPDTVESVPDEWENRLKARLTMMADLRNLVTAQEAFYSKNSQYATTMQMLGDTYRSSDGVRVEITRSTATQYEAKATHTDHSECLVVVGMRQSMARSGEPYCP